MLHQIVVACAVHACRCQQLAHDVELMVTGKDQCLARLFDKVAFLWAVDTFGFVFDVQIVADQVEQYVRLPDVFPQVRCLVAVGIDWILAAFVERQEVGFATGKPRRHKRFFVADSEMHQTTRKPAAVRLWDCGQTCTA